MLRKQNYSPDQLRGMFLAMAQENNWFGDGFQARLEQLRDEFPYVKWSDDDPLANVKKHIKLFFGPPSYEFLHPGDIPETFGQSAKRQVKLVHDPLASEYNAMRRATLNYASCPKLPQFVDSEDPLAMRYYWVVGLNLVNAVEADTVYEEFLSAMNDSEGGDGLCLQMKLPVKRNRTVPLAYPEVGSTLTLYQVNRRVENTQYMASVIVMRTAIKPGAKTGRVWVLL